MILLLVVFGAVGVAYGTDESSCTADARCPMVDNPPTFLPFALNCTRFYQCSYGRACEKVCPTGLHWSTTLNRCEWPSVACCDGTTACTPVQIPSTTTAAPITTTTATTVATPGTECVSDVRCPLNDNPLQPILLQHESSCGLFYACSYGKRCPLTCQTGQHFSVQLQRCEWPQFACCDASIPCQQLPTTPVIPTDAPVEQCQPDARCPLGDDLLNPLLLPVAGNCGAFYKCRTGDACLLPCPTGQHFSVQMQLCERPEVACCDPVC